jgi:hypothetical protein
MHSAQWTPEGLQPVLIASARLSSLEGLDLSGNVGLVLHRGALTSLIALAKYGNKLKTIEMAWGEAGDVDINEPLEDKGGDTERELAVRLRRWLRFNVLLAACSDETERADAMNKVITVNMLCTELIVS